MDTGVEALQECLCVHCSLLALRKTQCGGFAIGLSLCLSCAVHDHRHFGKPIANNSINVLAIDHAANGYNIGLTAMNALTNGNAVMLGRVDVAATEVDASNCGI